MIQYAIIGKIVYALCKMDSKRLRKIAKELSVLSKVKIKKSKKKRSSKKGKMKKGSAEAKAWGRKMKRLRNG